jgi:protein phosphatase PTC1
MNNNKNYHFKNNHVTNPLLGVNIKQNHDTQNNFILGNNLHDTKRYNEPNSLQKLNQQNIGIKHNQIHNQNPNQNFIQNQNQNQNQRKNNFDENNNNKKKKIISDNINSNNLRNNFKQQKININLNSNFNSGGDFEIQNKSPNFNVTKNRFLMNFNLPNLINFQDRVINFGQDKSENNFKKTLRKGASNLIKNSSLNIINNNPNSNNNVFTNSLRGVPNSSPFPQSTIDYLKAASSKEMTNTKSQMIKSPQNAYNNSINKYTGYNNNNNNNYASGGNGNGNLNINGNSFKNYSDSSSSNIYSTNSNSKDDNCNYIYEKNASSVKEYAYKEDPNYKCRGAMEDMSKLIDKFTNNPDVGLFSIYDGHGGAEIAKYLKNRIPEVLTKILSPLKNKFELNDLNYDIENSLNNVFHKVDEEIKLMPESEYMGSTAVLVLICKEKDHISPLSTRRVIYCANVGDSRCVLISNFSVRRLSYDHKASDTSEIERVNNSGGMIFNGRVFGQLIITRAFGDSSLKRYGVSATPYISKNLIGDKDKYLVLASDGIWDVIEDDELLRLSQNVSNSDELAKLIIKTSLLRGTQDNLSCIVLKL